MPNGQNGRNVDPGIRSILEELRDLRREMRADRVVAGADRRRSDERFAQVMHDFHDDATQQEARYLETTKTMFREIHTVGLAIVKTLNRHSRLLTSIDHKLGARGNGRPGPNGGRS